MIVPRYYEDLSVLHDNTMLARAYYMPASKRMDDLVEHRELSDRMQLLNGTWKFQYFDSIYDMKDAFYEDGYSRALTRLQFRVYGRWQVMIHINTQISVIHFRLIRHMCHRIFHVELMCIPLTMQGMMQHQRHILTLKVWIAAFMYG